MKALWHKTRNATTKPLEGRREKQGKVELYRTSRLSSRTGWRTIVVSVISDVGA